jgi:protein kinase A
MCYLNLFLEFIIACLTLCLEYIHKKRIIHRDIKPENLVFDSDGYVYLTDFGISKVKTSKNVRDTSGTPGYMAPECIFSKNHSFSVDFYAMGVLMHEIITKKKPYEGKERKTLRDQILNRQAKIKRNETNPLKGWSDNVIDLTNKLLCRKAYKRIGHSHVREIK